MDIYEIILALLGGFVAGVMNSLAGFGSIITLYFLMEVMGLPGTIANATNRVNVYAMSITGSFSFYKNGNLDLKRSKWYLISLFFGAMIGLYFALIVSDDQFKIVFKYLLLLLLLVLLFNPKKLITGSDPNFTLPLYILIPVFTIIGFYGGFIQAGSGLFVLVALGFLGKFNLLEGNATKLVSIALYTSVILAVFAFKGWVHWLPGIVLAIGMSIGSYVTIKFASKSPNANIWSYRLLILIIILVLIKTFLVPYLNF